MSPVSTAATVSPRPVRVAMIGYAFMGAAHSMAWRNVHRAFELPVAPEMNLLVGRDAEKVAAAARRLGWAQTSTSWRDAVERPDIDVVDICTPGDSHAEIALAALAAGKHVLCEKPLANSLAEAEQMAEAARRAGTVAMVGFTYRRVPALSLARRMIADGELGTLRHVRAAYLQDWIVDPEFPLVWRLQAEHAGSGALGDIGAHIADLAQFLTGQRIGAVSALTRTFVPERPLPGAAAGLGATAGAGRGPVTVDDAALFLARFDGGAVGTFEATRFATGRKNALRIEINGSDGSLAFDLEALNELWYYDGRRPAAREGFRRLLVTEPEHPYLEGWWPPGHGLGYDHAFTHQMRDFLLAVAGSGPAEPDFAAGLQVQRVLDAVQRSAEDGTWCAVPTSDLMPAAAG